jgi:signal transduction histidine kinase
MEGGAMGVFSGAINRRSGHKLRSGRALWLDSRAARYGSACVGVALMLLIKLHVPLLGESRPFLLFFGAIMAAGWHGGLGPGLFATLLSAIASDYYFLAPLHSLVLAWQDAFQLLIFCGEGTFMSLLCHSKRRIEETLREREQLNRTILDSLVAHIAVLDPQGEIIAVNAAWEEFARDNDVRDLTYIQPGSNYLETCRRAGDDARSALEGIGAVMSGRSERFVMEYSCHAPSEQRWFLLFATPLPAQKSFRHRFVKRLGSERGANRRGVVISHLDISERYQAELQRLDLLAREKAAREEAEHANRAKDEFLATVSHELRTPLNSILGWCQLLQSDQLDDGMQAQALGVIARSARAQAQLIEDLLDVSRIVSGKIVLETKSLELAPVVSSALETLQPEAQKKSLALEAQLDGEARVLGDARRLQQIMWNLVHNAIKFSPEGGRIDVSLRCLGHCVRLEVRDRGAGIKKEFLPHIFERFRQGEGGSTRRHTGLGLGLSIVLHIVEAHGGTISAHSEGENQGATFVVELPCLSSTPLASTPGADESAPERALSCA